MRFSVWDTGIGVGKDDQVKIFQRLHQTNPDDTSRKGLGLGLYIASDIVTRHGGKIWVDSELGLGSVFSFTLPVASSKSSEASDG